MEKLDELQNFDDIDSFYGWIRKGDYYRYLAEFKSGDEKKEAAELSLKAYEVCFCLVPIKLEC